MHSWYTLITLLKVPTPRWVDTWARGTVRWYWSGDTLFWQLSIDHNIDVQLVFTCAPKLAKKCKSRHWLPCGADGRSLARCTVAWLRNFLGWVDYHLSLAMGLGPRAAIRAEREAPLLHKQTLITSEWTNKDHLLINLTATDTIIRQKVTFAPGAYQMEPPSPLIFWVNPFPSRFVNRTASFPRKVSYFRESRVSPWKNKIGWSRTQKPVLRPFSFFPLRPFLQFYSRWDLGIMK